MEIYYNGNIITVDKYNTIVESIIVKNGLIINLGNSKDMLKLKENDSKLIDLNGNTLIPGFYDPHGHISFFSIIKDAIRLDEIKTINELINKIKNEIINRKIMKDQFVLCYGLDNTVFIEYDILSRYDIDKISTTNPILIIHSSGHEAICNSYIINDINNDKDLLKYHDNTIKNGKLSEVFINYYLGKKISKKQVFGTENINKILEYYISHGFTTIFDAGIDYNSYLLYKNIAEENKLSIDIYALSLIDCAKELIKDDCTNIKYENHYKIGGVKVWLDGSPLIKTSWLTKPWYNTYEYGNKILSDEKLISILKLCIENNWQGQFHVNGDAAIDQFLKCYKAVDGPKKLKNNRFVLIHCQNIREDQIKELSQYNIILSIFNDHVYYWGDYYYNVLLGSERSQNISPLGWANKYNIIYTLHQDIPIVYANQILAIHNAVNRKTKNNMLLGKEHCISVIDAIKAVTINCAYQNFEEKIKGSIEIGKYADFIILNKNPLTINKEEIKDIQILETIKNGKTIYKL